LRVGGSKEEFGWEPASMAHAPSAGCKHTTACLGFAWFQLRTCGHTAVQAARAARDPHCAPKAATHLGHILADVGGDACVGRLGVQRCEFCVAIMVWACAHAFTCACVCSSSFNAVPVKQPPLQSPAGRFTHNSTSPAASQAKSTGGVTTHWGGVLVVYSTAAACLVLSAPMLHQPVLRAAAFCQLPTQAAPASGGLGPGGSMRLWAALTDQRPQSVLCPALPGQQQRCWLLPYALDSRL
jgi:hypothetical protein